MDDRTARLFSALGVLVVVWIVVYWSWPAGEPAVTTSMNDVELITAPVREPRPTISRSPPGPAEGSERGTPDDTEKADGAGAIGGVIPPEFEAYVVRPDDNYERISRRVYGVSKYAMAIARANPLQDPQKLRVGQTIRVPKDPGNIQGRPADEDADAPKPAPEPVTIEYTVRRGDTLSGIAKAFYGSIRHTDFLFEANRDRLRSEDDLRLGQVLLIPPLPGGAGPTGTDGD